MSTIGSVTVVTVMVLSILVFAAENATVARAYRLIGLATVGLAYVAYLVGYCVVVLALVWRLLLWL